AGSYTTPRDEATYQIFREVEAGRGSPHGGAYLDFRGIDPVRLREGFGPVIDILEKQGIDLARDMVEVAPTAHYMLSGIEVDPAMQTSVPGLLACGEAINGMHGANRLSGNAITEALVTGRIAGERAAAQRHGGARLPLTKALDAEWSRLRAWWHPRSVSRDEASIDALKERLQHVMWADAGPLRTREQLERALANLGALKAEAEDIALAPVQRFALPLQEKLELHNMIAVSEAIVLGALAREETRGAHVRLDFPEQAERAISRAFRLSAQGRWSIEAVHAEVAA
ncbi:MAG TPA: FAD-binding protein, partial [Candidatus Acidoferrum sp.]|nr:FAD-binding protein [Candidatus Acidoferrum sp.]